MNKSYVKLKKLEKELNKRQISAINTKEKILKATKKLMSKKSLEDVTIDEITNLAKVAKGSFYVYFKDKLEAVSELNKSDFYKLDEIVNAKKNKTIIEKLEYYAYEFLKRIEGAGIETCRNWIRANVKPYIRKELNNKTKFDYDYNAIIKILKYAVQNNELKKDAPIEEIALYINAELYGLMISWCMTDGKIKGSNKIKLTFNYFVSKYLNDFIKK